MSDFGTLWRQLSNNQRLYLMNRVAPREQQVKQSMFVVAIRALERRGLIKKSLHGVPLTEQARELVGWAREHGYARFDDGEWVFTVPPQRYPWRSIERGTLTELAAAGHHGSEIAEKLGVSREAVRLAAKRYEVSLPRKQKKPPPPKSARAPRTKREKAIILRVSLNEYAAIRDRAEQAGMSMSAYMRAAAMETGQPLLRRRLQGRNELVSMPLGDVEGGEQHLGHGQPSSGRGGQLEGRGAQRVAGLLGEADGDVRHDRYGSVG